VLVHRNTLQKGLIWSAADQRSQEVSTEDLVDLVAVEVLEVAPESTPDEVAQADENTPDLAADPNTARSFSANDSVHPGPVGCLDC